MKKLLSWLALLLCLPLISYKAPNACEYAGSNLGYIKTNTQKAVEADSLSITKYFAYKALSAIEKSKKQMESCGCAYAISNINEGSEHLKRATRISSIQGSKMLLQLALENIEGSLAAISEHHLHDTHYQGDVLALNTKVAMEEKILMERADITTLKVKIDQSLVKFQNSLDEVLKSVDCKEAFAFTSRIYKNCERELLKDHLTEGKKYYHLRTQQITGVALQKLGDCSGK